MMETRDNSAPPGHWWGVRVAGLALAATLLLAVFSYSLSTERRVSTLEARSVNHSQQLDRLERKVDSVLSLVVALGKK